MKKTFNIIGASVLGAAVLFGASSCNSHNSDSGYKEPTKAVKDTVVMVANANTALPSVVYVDMTKLMDEYQMAVDLRAEVQGKIDKLTKEFENKKNSAEKEISKKQNNLQTKAKDFEDKYNKGHLTETNAKVKLQELQKLEEEFNAFVTKKGQELEQEQYKLQNTANEELFVMNNVINDAINTFIQKYRVEKGYTMILISQSDIPDDGATNLGAPVLAADPSLDITADVVTRLNEEYKAL